MTSLFAVEQDDSAEGGGVLTGIAIAQVTKNDDDSGLARVKVSFPWHDNPDETHWARVLTPMAGAARGLLLIPEVGDEVAVLADRGSIEHLYVIGSLWNGVDRPPANPADNKNDIRKLTSRSGHELIFDDADDGGVEIHHQSGTRLHITEERVEIDTAGNTIVVDGGSGEVSIRSNSAISLEASRISLNAQSRLSLTSSGQVEIRGTTVSIN